MHEILKHNKLKRETRALRAHTRRTPCIYIIVQLGHMLLTTFTYTYEASAHEHKYMHNNSGHSRLVWLQ